MSRVTLLKWILLMALLLFVAAIIVPHIPFRRHRESPVPCSLRMHILNKACILAADALKKQPGAPLSWEDIDPYLPDWIKKREYYRTCPDGGSYVLPKVGNKPACPNGHYLVEDELLRPKM